MKKNLSGVLLILIVLENAPLAQADEEDTLQMATLFPDGRHLVQMSYTRVDSAEAEIEIWLPNYTYAYSRSLRFSLSAGFSTADDIDALLGTPQAGKSFSGVADSHFLVQYDPGARLTANAFIPDTMGFTFGLQVPTGDQDKRLGVDAWVGQLGAGWLVDFPLDFWLLPSIQYFRSFGEGNNAPETDRATMVLGLYWLFPVKAWLGLEPAFGYDFLVDETVQNFAVVAGKSWSSGWGVEVRWDRLDRVDPGARRDDKQLFFNISYQFGKPPRE